jgi:alkanesulfonate monooxygenase SsuD/methylene tetrahydromethanopterin reductase-like flavin-dependent oxidoreductase (luciferase family)
MPVGRAHGLTSAAHADRKDIVVATPTFGVFDHIEGIPGTPTHELFRDRLDLIKRADEAGFEAFYLAEHHGSDLCMAPNQELFIAAASQITTRIRLGPMVKLLPLHHPVRILEDMCVADQLTGGRLDFGVGRGVAPIEHAWFGSDWTEGRERFEDTLGIICNALATGEISSEGSRYHDFPTAPLATKPIQNPIPFWYPGNPGVAGRHGMSLMWPGPVPQDVYETYVDAWETHRGDTLRVDGPDSRPRVGITMVVAIAPTEQEALDISRRGMTGLVRRAEAVHARDRLILSEVDCDKALRPLYAILAHIEDAIAAGAGTVDQIAERFAAILEPGLIEHVALQLPVGDMTYEEATRTFEIFAAEVKPQLERAFLAA